MLNILFVCTGNTCRSKMAEQLAKHIIKKRGLESAVKVSSAGTNIALETKTTPYAKLALKTLGVQKAMASKAKSVDSLKLSKFNYIICMTENHKAYILSKFSGLRVGTFDDHIGGGDIMDPYGQDFKTYKQTATELNEKIEKLLDKLITIF